MRDGNDEYWVQSAVTSVSFPRTLERLRAMGLKWLNILGRDWTTDMDILLDFPQGSDVNWIAPKWLMAGDILFFYHTKSALNITKKLYRSALSLNYDTELRRTANIQTQEDAARMAQLLSNSVTMAETYSGTIFGYAEVSGRPIRTFDENKHFYGTVYAPLLNVYIFKNPLSVREFSDILRIGQNTTTPIYGYVFEKLKTKLEANNTIPPSLSNAKPGRLGFREVKDDNWESVSCNNDTRFIDEEQIRTYFIDYLLKELKDPSSSVYLECTCYKNGDTFGRADYFFQIGGSYIPVEAKLNVIVEHGLVSQVLKYTHTDFFIPTKGVAKDKMITLDDSPFCIVMDQAGLYLLKDGEFVSCSVTAPLFERKDLHRGNTKYVRDHLMELINSNL